MWHQTVQRVRLLEYEFGITWPVHTLDSRRGFRYPADVCFGFSRHGQTHTAGELAVTSGRRVHRIASAVSPGVLGIRWE